MEKKTIRIEREVFILDTNDVTSLRWTINRAINTISWSMNFIDNKTVNTRLDLAREDLLKAFEEVLKE